MNKFNFSVNLIHAILKNTLKNFNFNVQHLFSNLYIFFFFLSLIPKRYSSVGAPKLNWLRNISFFPTFHEQRWEWKAKQRRKNQNKTAFPKACQAHDLLSLFSVWLGNVRVFSNRLSMIFLNENCLENCFCFFLFEICLLSHTLFRPNCIFFTYIVPALTFFEVYFFFCCFAVYAVNHRAWGRIFVLRYHEIPLRIFVL